jgi:hypothetical protein
MEVCSASVHHLVEEAVPGRKGVVELLELLGGGLLVVGGYLEGLDYVSRVAHEEDAGVGFEVGHVPLQGKVFIGE